MWKCPKYGTHSQVGFLKKWHTKKTLKFSFFSNYGLKSKTMYSDFLVSYGIRQEDLLGCVFVVKKVTNGQSQEERQPAENEHAHHHSQSLGSFLLSGEPEQFGCQCTWATTSSLRDRTGVLLVLAVDPQGELVGVLLTLLHHACFQIFGGTFSHNIDPAIHCQNDGKRDVEGSQRWKQGIERFLCDEAHRVILEGSKKN